MPGLFLVNLNLATVRKSISLSGVNRSTRGPSITEERSVRAGISHGDLEVMKSVIHLAPKNLTEPAERQYIPMRHESVWDTCWNTGNQDGTGSFGEQASE